MLEIGFVIVVVAGAALVIGRLGRTRPDGDTTEDGFVDLPCPWCQSATREDDKACPSCAHPFGAVTSL